jgi:hypothetical protein
MQSQIHVSPAPIGRPRCTKCGWPMLVEGIEPTKKPNCEQRTFACPRCNHSETVVAKVTPRSG